MRQLSIKDCSSVTAAALEVSTLATGFSAAYAGGLAYFCVEIAFGRPTGDFWKNLFISGVDNSVAYLVDAIIVETFTGVTEKLRVTYE